MQSVTHDVFAQWIAPIFSEATPGTANFNRARLTTEQFLCPYPLNAGVSRLPQLTLFAVSVRCELAFEGQQPLYGLAQAAGHQHSRDRDCVVSNYPLNAGRILPGPRRSVLSSVRPAAAVNTAGKADQHSGDSGCILANRIKIAVSPGSKPEVNARGRAPAAIHK